MAKDSSSASWVVPLVVLGTLGSGVGLLYFLGRDEETSATQNLSGMRTLAPSSTLALGKLAGLAQSGVLKIPAAPGTVAPQAIWYTYTYKGNTYRLKQWPKPSIGPTLSLPGGKELPIWKPRVVAEAWTRAQAAKLAGKEVLSSWSPPPWPKTKPGTPHPLFQGQYYAQSGGWTLDSQGRDAKNIQKDLSAAEVFGDPVADEAKRKKAADIATTVVFGGASTALGMGPAVGVGLYQAVKGIMPWNW